MLPNFLKFLKHMYICRKVKKIHFYHCLWFKNNIFQHFMIIFCVIKPIFIVLGFYLKSSFPQNFKRSQIVDEELGTPTCCRKWSPGNNSPHETPKSMCGHQAQGKKSATKSTAGKNLKNTPKIASFHMRARLYLMCADTIFCSKSLFGTYLCSENS